MIEKIGHYSITNPASLYDEEALTALELAGRTAGKVNECVGAFNELDEDVNKRLDAQDKAIPEKIADEVESYINDGAFDEAIDRYAGEVTERLDNIVSEAGDSNTEIVDMRLGVNGTNYTTAGQALRSQIKARSGMAILLPSSSGDYPSISTTDKTFTIGGDTLLISDRLKNGFVSLIESSGNSSVTWDMTSSAICFYYDIDTNKLVALPYSTKVDNFNYILIATLRTSYKGSRAVCSSPIYVDGVLSTEPFQLAGFTALLPPFDTVTCYPKFSSDDKTLTFANDTLIIDPRLPSYYVSLHETNANNVVDLSEYATTAVCVYYGVKEAKLVVKPYSTRVNAFEYLLICTVRKPSTSERGMVWASCPVWIDDRLSTEEIGHINKGSITTVKAINHRGACSEAPENTLSAFKLSKKLGFDYVECDVAFTSDGEAVLLHDTTIDRTSNGTGNIADLTLAHVRTLDFGSWHSSRYVGEKIPTFKEFIALCKSLGLHAYIELKAGSETQIKDLARTVRMYGMRDKVSYISFFPELLGYVKEVDAKARLGFITSTGDNTAIETCKSIGGNVFLDLEHSSVNDTVVALCAENDIELEVWTVNSEASIAGMNPYISGVTSDSLHAGVVLFDTTITGTMTTAPDNLPTGEKTESDERVNTLAELLLTNEATAGQVLTADGEGSATWEDAPESSETGENYQLKGTYIFDDNPTINAGTTVYEYITFQNSAGKEYQFMAIRYDASSGKTYISYDDFSEDYGESEFNAYYDGWGKSEHKTVSFPRPQTVSKEFFNVFTSITTKQ